MSMQAKRREAFEACWASLLHPLSAPYVKSAAWRAWNAALDSVAIELPNIETDHPIEIEAQADMRSRCREAIESAGVKVKP